MLNYLEYLRIPAQICVIIIACFLLMQIVGEILEFKGKIVPEYLKVRKYFSRKKKEKEETTKTLKAVEKLLKEVNAHYSEDNISKRDSWMCWVNDRAKAYDNSIVSISQNLSNVTEALQSNTRLTEEMFVQSSRDRIIDFAMKVADEKVLVSREEFNRIFKVYKKYEEFLEEHGMTNGEIDISYRIIIESYEKHMRHHSFIEDIRQYTPVE